MLFPVSVCLQVFPSVTPNIQAKMSQFTTQCCSITLLLWACANSFINSSFLSSGPLWMDSRRIMIKEISVKKTKIDLYSTSEGDKKKKDFEKWLGMIPRHLTDAEHEVGFRLCGERSTLFTSYQTTSERLLSTKLILWPAVIHLNDSWHISIFK